MKKILISSATIDLQTQLKNRQWSKRKNFPYIGDPSEVLRANSNFPGFHHTSYQDSYHLELQGQRHQ